MRFVLLMIAVLGLAACSADGNILPGERIAIVGDSSVHTVAVDADAAAEGALLPTAAVNKSFTAQGGNAGHSGGHFKVDFPLERIFAVNVGAAAADGTELAQAVATKDAIVTITPGGLLRASDPLTGALLWQQDIDPSLDDTQTNISGGLGILGNQLVAHASKYNLQAFDIATGETQWQVDFDVFLQGGPTVSQGAVLVSDIDGRIYALTARDGEQVWTRIGNQGSTGIVGAPSPAVSGGEVIASGGDGELVALSLDQGNFLWGENLTPIELQSALDSIAVLRSPPIHDGGIVYAATASGTVHAFNAKTGQVIWQVPLRSYDMPMLAGDTVFLATIDGRLYALRRDDGAVRWQSLLPGAHDPSLAFVEDGTIYTTPLVVSGKVIVASNRGEMLIFDANTGAQESRISTNGAVTTPPIVVNGRVYVLNRNGQLLGFE